ncbi:hypothetical protein QN219_32475 [Sinorhizobium sp. 7-81]|uniref:hypothetical protein n=1 Tax=Sinorhizobium sp. 8-89 TaxID=3049089 RepID=UPI0024C27761|nr:hypothetical protein [Sinorhizobium sp. 8-89]MDK1494636.1 hypothetical protein [Sinorhizobium sp. 8-89]
MRLVELKLKPSLLSELNQLGYEAIEDIQHLSCRAAAGMGGHDWRKIAKALGREPSPEMKKR